MDGHKNAHKYSQNSTILQGVFHGRSWHKKAEGINFSSAQYILLIRYYFIKIIFFVSLNDPAVIR